MSAGAIKAGGAHIEFGIRYNKVIAGLNDIAKHTKATAGHAKGIAKLGGALQGMGPAASAAAGPIRGLTGGLSAMMSMNPATWGVMAAGGLYAYCDAVLKADLANQKALVSGERLERLYGKEIAALGSDGAVSMNMDMRTQSLIDEKGVKGASDTVKDELESLREEYRRLEKEARDFGWSQEEINKMANGEMDQSFFQSVKDNLKFGYGSDYTDDLHGRQSALQATAARIKANAEALEQLEQVEKKTSADRWKDRKKAADDFAASLKKATEAAEAADAANATHFADKAASERIENDPTAAIREWLDAEGQARNQESAAIARLREIKTEMDGLQSSGLTHSVEEAARLASLEKEMKSVAAAREKATADVARAVKHGEKAAQAAKKEADEIAKVSKERADLTAKLRDMVDGMGAADMEDGERKRFELARRQARERADYAKADEDALQALRKAHIAERGRLERDLAKEAADREAKNADVLAAHQMDFLPAEYQERARMMKQFQAEQDALAAQSYGPDSPQMKELKAWQEARLKIASAEIGLPNYSTSGGFASASAARGIAQGAVQKESDNKKMLALSEDMRRALFDIRSQLDGGMPSLI